ncbi:nicotinate phosphoribosyltransferase [Cellulosilyticum lentocellum]|uniref:Nicotinate phosphoribosyltransferase n=1 Tax=Cellulosilyticum lentocellum (strain ATCC 49066 / DSM 5427 / NCIMB 11756 / RHM5) TaxID=642492 RepID=F2JGY4_CELLD|nr:nicotinate phosphoribosyltransferase [Cellulosilyticum lentocellum]ADZ85324.1 nicotinate phosphoribosyltransferase [Cellulosilyticum lentocellum DSM 5427]
MEKRNLTLLTDLYQLTMMQGYYKNDTNNHEVVFDLFYRSNPSKNGYAICAGLEQAIDYIQNLNFNDADIKYLDSLNLFQKDFLEYLRGFRFTGDIYAIPEGTVVFPMEPLLRVKAPIFEAQFVETALLNIINHQSLIATKAARVVKAAEGDPVLEFGLRRAQGPDAGIYGARAAIIGGCAGTSNVLTGQMFDVPVSGTHAHSWVMSFDEEIEAFRAYAKLFPEKCILLVDTYDTLESGVPNAIKVFDEMKKEGLPMTFYGIRLDSGDLAYLSKKARAMLDAAGYKDAIISASCDLDEMLIADLKRQGAQITLWGVGTNMITSSDCPSFGGIYKLAAELHKDGEEIPKIKISDNPEKVTNPGVKKVVRVYDKATKKVTADIIALEHEQFNEEEELILYAANARWKKIKLRANSYTLRELLVPVFKAGQKVYESPNTMSIKAYAKEELDTLWEEYKRLVNPQIMQVVLSDKLYALREKMLENYKRD